MIAIASFAALAWQGFGSQSVRAQAKGPSFELAADHVGLSVPDLEKSIDWYEQMLGFHLVRRTNGKSMQIALLR
ncbi:MAG: VOC family protein, partial [Terriglobia bacterium]